MLSTRKTFLLISMLAVLTSAAWAQEPMKPGKNKTFAGTNPVTGSGTPGQVAKWTGVSGSNTFTLGDSNIFEDKFGRVGIGTATPTSLLTVQGMIETTLGGYKFPDGTVQTTAGISFVTHDASLAGLGTAASPLGIAPGGVQTVHLANGAVTMPKIADGAVTASKIANGTVVRSLNGLFDNLTLAQGANITITTAGNTLTIAAPNSLSSVAHDSTLTGSGTSGSPLGVAAGGIGNTQLANNAVTLSKIASGQVVTEINNLTDSVTLAAGANITINQSGNTLTIAGAAGSSVSYHVLGPDSGTLNAPGVDVVSKQVPAGSYIIFFRTFLTNQDSDSQDAACSLSTGNGDSLIMPEKDDPGGRVAFVLRDAATFSATTTITAHCTGFKVGSGNATLTALRVDSIQ